MSEYVYGVVAAGTEPPAAPGVRGARVELVGGNGSAALVSDLPEAQLELGREEVLAHARVLEEVVARDEVLPMRFGVIMADPGDVRTRLLEAHGDELERQLEALAGKVELSVRAVYEEGPLMREVVRQHPEIEQLRQSVRNRPEAATYFDRIQLGEFVAQAVEQKREIDAHAIVQALRGLADDVAMAEITHERVVVSASFLVSRGRLEEFDAAVERLAQDNAGQMRIKYTGPLPPYSFVELSGA